jgi:hypothetical protein
LAERCRNVRPCRTTHHHKAAARHSKCCLPQHATQSKMGPVWILFWGSGLRQQHLQTCSTAAKGQNSRESSAGLGVVMPHYVSPRSRRPGTANAACRNMQHGACWVPSETCFGAVGILGCHAAAPNSHQGSTARPQQMLLAQHATQRMPSSWQYVSGVREAGPPAPSSLGCPTKGRMYVR